MFLNRSIYCLIVASLAFAVSSVSAAEDQSTTSTRQYKPVPGTRLVYETSAKLQISGGVQRQETGKFRSTFTVLEQRPDGRVLLAEIDQLGADSTATSDTKPAARFTLNLPPEGAVPGETIQTAGFVGSPFKGWKFESLFPPVPADGVTSSNEMLDIIGAPVDMERDVKSVNGVSTVRASLAPGADENLKQHSYEFQFAESDGSILQTSQTSAVEIQPGQGVRALISLYFETRRVETRKLGESELEVLTKDVAAAVPLATRIRSLSMAGEEAVEQTLNAINDYVSQNPTGAFTPLYREIGDQVARSRAIQENSKKVAEGSPAPDFEGAALDGKKFKLSALRGKVVLLDFWATWCGPCVGLIPSMKRIHEDNKDKPFVLLGISADHEESALREFVKEKQLEWPQIFEGEGTTGSALMTYGVMKFPTTVLIDAQGQIRKVDAHGDELTQAIDELIGEAK